MCPREFLQMADSDIIVSLHLVIPFISLGGAKFFQFNYALLAYLSAGYQHTHLPLTFLARDDDFSHSK